MLGKPCFSQYEMYPISGYFSKLGAHQTMLEDKSRLESYNTALKSFIIPKKSVVIDIGTGTGILAMMAAKLGAKHVHAIEAGKIANIAEKIISDNKLSSKITVHKSLSSEVNINDKADIIVSETMGFTGLEEGIVDIFREALLKFGHRDTKIIPSKVKVSLVPVSDGTVQNEILNFWSIPIHNFDYSYIQNLATNNIFSRQLISENEYLSDPEEVYALDLSDKAKNLNEETKEFLIGRNDTLYGFSGWFTVDLTDQIVLSSSPQNKLNHWQQFFIPIKKPVFVNTNDTVKIVIKMQKHFGLTVFTWEITVNRNDIVIAHSSGNIEKLLNAIEGKS